jgi:hypothetical protein
MEKSEKHRFSSKTKEIPSEKGKRHSKMLTKPKKVDYENQNPNSNIMMQQSVPIVQGQQFYGMQPGKMMTPYGLPATMNGGLPPNEYIMNQINPVPVTPLKFGILAMDTLCPFCQTNAPTKIEESFNCCTCFCYSFIILLIPILLIIAAYAGCSNVHCHHGCACDCDCNCCRCNDGDCRCDCKCCIDVNHYCSNCGKLLGTRDSCQELCPCFSNCLC